MTAPIEAPPVPDETAPEATAEAPAAPAAATLKPARRLRFGRPSNPWNLATVVAISFSLTFVGVSVALLMGVLPASVASIQPPVDLGVLMLMVPLCALFFTMLAEVLLAAIRGLPRIRAPRPTPALSAWRPGHGEG